MIWFQIHYEFQVGLVTPGESKPYCGGSILSSKTILTAAHCTQDTSAGNIVVVVAEHDWTVNDGQQRFSVCSKKEHPSFDRFWKITNLKSLFIHASWSLDFDFSILTLCNDITFQREASPVCLPNQLGSFYDDVTATVSGWGTLSTNGASPQEVK